MWNVYQLDHYLLLSLPPPGLVGLAISYALSITNLLSGVVSSFTETEKQMVSVERADQYIKNVEPEFSEAHVEVTILQSF